MTGDQTDDDARTDTHRAPCTDCGCSHHAHEGAALVAATDTRGDSDTGDGGDDPIDGIRYRRYPADYCWDCQQWCRSYRTDHDRFDARNSHVDTPDGGTRLPRIDLDIDLDVDLYTGTGPGPGPEVGPDG